MFPVEEVCGGKGLIDKYPSSSLYLIFLVITHDSLRGIFRAVEV
jgi:hypothetical protein